MIEKVERLITEINRIHREYSKDYFEAGKVKKSISRYLSKVPTKAILSYRLNLHESINDYLMAADVQDITYVYRKKTSESILDKITRFSPSVKRLSCEFHSQWYFWCSYDFKFQRDSSSHGETRWLARVYGLKRYLRDKDGYVGIHIYFKDKSNFYYPWELQLWDKKDVDSKYRQSYQV